MSNDNNNNNNTRIKNAILVNEFSEQGFKNFKNDFDDINCSNLPIIPIIIDSFGGDVYSLLAMIDVMSTASKPIATIAIGKAMSCGSVLLTCGSRGLRFVGPNATVMVHDVATLSFGKIEELKADVGEAERLNVKIFNILNTRCDQPKGFFQKKVSEKKHINWFLDPREVLKYGLADHIGVPIIDSFFNLDIVKEFSATHVSSKVKVNRKKTRSKNEKVVLRKKRGATRKSGK